MEELKREIARADNAMLLSILVVYKDLLSKLPKGGPAYNRFNIVISMIEEEINNRGLQERPVTKEEKARAINYMNQHGMPLNGNDNRKENNSPFHNFIVGAIGLFGFIAVVIIIAILKELAVGVASLWTSGVLPIILGIAAVSGGLIYGSKHGWFKKLKNLFIEEVPATKTNTKSSNNVKTNNVTKQNTVTNTKQETIVEEKPKENKSKITVTDRLASLVAALVIGSSGVALVNHNTELFDNNWSIKRYTDGIEGFYNSMIRSVRVAFHDTFNNYEIYKDLGYLDKVEYKEEYENQKHVIRDTKLDALHVIYKDGETWEEISYDYFGTTEYAHQLQLYNGYFDIPSKPLKKKDMVFVPTLENLEAHINYRR